GWGGAWENRSVIDSRQLTAGQFFCQYSTNVSLLRARSYIEREVLTLDQIEEMQGRLNGSIGFRRECLGLMRERVTALGQVVQDLPIEQHLGAFFTGTIAAQIGQMGRDAGGSGQGRLDLTAYQDIRSAHLRLLEEMDHIERDVYRAGIDSWTGEELLLKTKISVYSAIVARYLMFLDQQRISRRYDARGLSAVFAVHRAALELVYIRDELFYRSLCLADGTDFQGVSTDTVEVRSKLMERPHRQIDVVQDLDLGTVSETLVEHLLESLSRTGTGAVTPRNAITYLRSMFLLAEGMQWLRESCHLCLPDEHVRLRRSSLYMLFYVFNEGLKNALANFMTESAAGNREAPDIEIRLSSVGSNAEVRFSNNQCSAPVDPDTLRRIFIPGFTSRGAEQRNRLTDSETRAAVYGGLGFGLSKIYYMVHEVLGGDVRVYARGSDGRTYCVEPRLGLAQVTEADPAEVPYDGGTGFVLVVTLPGAYTVPAIQGHMRSDQLSGV
ncbi:MAG: hypothetical protein WCG78_08340, partial [Candidatus Omnitrophota bacterium]